MSIAHPSSYPESGPPTLRNGLVQGVQGPCPSGRGLFRLRAGARKTSCRDAGTGLGAKGFVTRERGGEPDGAKRGLHPASLSRSGSPIEQGVRIGVASGTKVRDFIGVTRRSASATAVLHWNELAGGFTTSLVASRGALLQRPRLRDRTPIARLLRARESGQRRSETALCFQWRRIRAPGRPS